FARSALEHMGCDVQVFESGEAFLAHASREAACVILNYVMPHLTGPEVFSRMRKGGWNIPVISESVYGEYEARAAYGGGQVAHVACPWQLTEFEAVLRVGLLAAGYCLPPKGVMVFDPAFLTWNEGLVPKLACSISEERAFHFLPILADALE